MSFSTPISLSKFGHRGLSKRVFRVECIPKTMLSQEMISGDFRFICVLLSFGALFMFFGDIGASVKFHVFSRLL